MAPPPMAEASGMRYVWFDRAVVVHSQTGFGCECVVDGRRVPLPVAMVHPDCTLGQAGDAGPLGVPEWWAIEHGLIAEPIDGGGGETKRMPD